MRIRIKGVCIAALTAAVLATTACGGSDKPAPKPTSPGPALTADKVISLLLTDKDQPGYIYDASQDARSTKSAQDVVTVGGGICQTFVDAAEVLSTKYGTTVEIDRSLHKNGQGTTDSDTILDGVMVLPSTDKAASVITDLTAGLKGCKSLTMTQSEGPVSMTLTTLPQATEDGRAAYIDTTTFGSNSLLTATELVRAGTAVVAISLIAPSKNDPATLQPTLTHLADIQVGRVKAAQGIG